MELEKTTTEEQPTFLRATAKSGCLDQQETSKWAGLQTRRQAPGCSKINNKVVIAGGYSEYEYSDTHISTEVLDLATRKITRAGDMTTPRLGFRMLTMTTEGLVRVLALAGRDHTSIEEFDPDNLIWKTTPENVLVGRDSFGAVALPKKLICPVQN